MGSNRLARIWPPAAVMAALLIVWQAGVMWSGIEKWLLPSPLDVGREAIAIAPRLLENTWATTELTLLGFIGGAAAGFVLAAVLHIIPGTRIGVYPLLVLTQNVPIIALGPLLVLWLGYGLLPKVLLVVIVCFFPICVAMLTGLTQSDPKLRNYMLMIGTRRSQLFWRLELPHAVPYLFSGLKIAASYSVTSAVVAEWIGSQSGLGHFMLLSSKSYKAPRVFAAVILIVALSLILFGLVVLAERMVVRWRQAEGDH
ncbi:ABC transporter permease [Paenibacillus sp. GCM10023252]|uniref:ABC transporter permease n=1 Tax=Paenibacillus sp. GCM10023252 TaxID=3252649 RepID=UPI00362010E9